MYIITLCEFCKKITDDDDDDDEERGQHAAHADRHYAPVLIETCRVGVLIHLFDIRSVFFTVETLREHTHHVVCHDHVRHTEEEHSARFQLQCLFLCDFTT